MCCGSISSVHISWASLYIFAQGVRVRVCVCLRMPLQSVRKIDDSRQVSGGFYTGQK